MHSTKADHPTDTWEREQSRWDIARAIDDALERTTRKDGLPAGGYEMQLAAVLDRYAGRRTVAAHMLRDCAELAVGRVAEVEAMHATYVRGLTDSHAAEVAALRTDLETERRAVRALQAELAGARVVHEDRRSAGSAFGGDKVACAFTNGSSVAIWSPAQLEEVAYRVRAAGGSDDEQIHVRVNDPEKKSGAFRPVEFVAYLPDMTTLNFDLSTAVRPGARAVAPAAASSPTTWAQWWPPSRSPVVTALAAFIVGLLIAVGITSAVIR